MEMEKALPFFLQRSPGSAAVAHLFGRIYDAAGEAVIFVVSPFRPNNIVIAGGSPGPPLREAQLAAGRICLMAQRQWRRWRVATT